MYVMKYIYSESNYYQNHLSPISASNNYFYLRGGNLHNVEVNMLDSNIVVSDFEIQWGFTFGLIPLERYDLPYPFSYGLDSTTTVLQQGLLRHEKPTKVDMPLNKKERPFYERVPEKSKYVGYLINKVNFT